MDKKWKMHIIIYVVVIICIALGFIATRIYANNQSSKLRTYSFTAKDIAEEKDGISISVSISKQWDDAELHSAVPKGAQYDGIVKNNSSYAFHKWSAVLEFSKKPYIDSSWNGEFKTKGNKVFFTAEDMPKTNDDPAYIEANRESTFGAIMYATDLMELKGCKISGYREVGMAMLPAFWLLIIASILLLLVIFVNGIVYVRLRGYRLRQEEDSKIIRQSMNTFIEFIDAKDSYTKGHSARVAAYVCEIARRMKMKDEEIDKLYYITLMHDCGKIGIPDAVLKKPGKLSDEEFELIKSHTTLGDHVLVNFTAIPEIRDGAHYHHERYDGAGYPEGLKGNDIPLVARMICVADSFDAMSTNRCYRDHLDNDTILRELRENSGSQFDPDMVKYMIQIMEDGFTDKVLKENQ